MTHGSIALSLSLSLSRASPASLLTSLSLSLSGVWAAAPSETLPSLWLLLLLRLPRTSMNRRCLSLQPFHIPTSCRQPRSQGCRPRPLRGHEDGCLGTASTSYFVIDTPVSTQAEEDLFAVKCSSLLDAGLEEQPVETESAAKNSPSATSNSGCSGQHSRGCLLSNLIAEPSSPTPNKPLLKVTRSLGSLVAPGSVVWAKTAYHEWWPAEVVDRRVALENGNNPSEEGLVLIQLYGIYEYAWVDPVNNLSQFDHCYEERSKDTSKAFQDALNQAIRRKESTSSSEQLSDEKSDKWSMLSSCRTNDDPVHEGKCKRKRKAKVHFDDITFPENSVRRMRRMKIMRSLGLTAPVGSPFSRPQVRRRS